MANNAQIVGWSHSKFGKSEAPDLEALIREVVPAALDHAGVEAQQVDGIYLGVYNNGFLKQSFEAGLVGMAVPELKHVPANRLENACATGSAALYAALDFINAGRGRVALVIGAEKMTAIPSQDAANLMLQGSYFPEEGHFDAGFAGVFGHIAQNYFQRYGDRSEELAMISSKNHRNGMLNPYAHMQKDFSVAFCNTISDKNPYVAPPLRRTDCSLISDGAAAMVIADADTAAGLQRAIAIRARTQVNDSMALSRRDPTEFAGATQAWAKSLAQAGLTLDDLDFVETHDCFTIAEMIEYEAMGLAERGRGGDIIRDGVTQRDGKLPVNPSGGLKARGHPLGATGVSMHVMAAMQLAGEAGEMQLPKADRAGVFNMGGAAVANYTSILERVK
ncbi:acetyl-CoA acetyltransferase [Pseudooceanicola lipolyticus]|uniref:Acetyl-CoA acetyltransferase n=1 Tax=Pseudooceanicola lipolyticus TaxID=2029104 RepID=A0A2M8J5N4_9RHOB|nr:acetyl-CoA acetyltransferase [Pseudooceanicola lipolyticus]PJE38092.1 acetyl-CoA acetyltransferase [Pseudooceanicola lipolyticus]